MDRIEEFEKRLNNIGAGSFEENFNFLIYYIREQRGIQGLEQLKKYTKDKTFLSKIDEQIEFIKNPPFQIIKEDGKTIEISPSQKHLDKFLGSCVSIEYREDCRGKDG